MNLVVDHRVPSVDDFYCEIRTPGTFASLVIFSGDTGQVARSQQRDNNCRDCKREKPSVVSETYGDNTA